MSNIHSTETRDQIPKSHRTGQDRMAEWETTEDWASAMVVEMVLGTEPEATLVMVHDNRDAAVLVGLLLAMGMEATGFCVRAKWNRRSGYWLNPNPISRKRRGETRSAVLLSCG